MAEGVKHDYHLVNPSPWPLVGAIAATVMALGGVTWMKGLFGLPQHTAWLFFAGLAGVLFTMIVWCATWSWKPTAATILRWSPSACATAWILFIASEVMFFVAWFWIFFEMALFHGQRTGAHEAIDEVRTAWTHWPPQGIETVPAFQLPLVNTLTLLLSGTTVTWAHHALQTGDRKGAKIGLLPTICLGVLFTSIQAYEYNHILEHHYFFGGEGAATPGSMARPSSWPLASTASTS